MFARFLVRFPGPRIDIQLEILVSVSVPGILGIANLKCNNNRYAKQLKWKWAGHVARLTDHRWTKTVTTWRGRPGKRYRGRPCTRWDDIKKIAGPQWIQIALDRERWQVLEEPFTEEGS
ncbi:jg5116 [Pararge aegeria aegeria]|uniref:Jg5116 protein n=1 Tax=Pararge aegeria aegeria TaxID=348720 RepID=A0A8S4S463_9NEOP|nr:jg5116 [Pararge aegeria aegeria]